MWVIQNGKARLRIVTIGDSDGAQVRILTGLNGNDTVALNNQSQLFDGAEVTNK